MDLSRMGLRAGIFLLAIIVGLAIPVVSSAEELANFTSKEYGFVMKYPSTWVKVEPSGSYYLVFQNPDLVNKFRPRIHIAAHKPVRDPISVFVKELRNGITDLKKRDKVKIIEEGKFNCDVPGAYYFYLQALNDKPKVWMDIVIVFYKHDKTLVRISCLAPSQSMERFQQLFNDVLTSVKFVGAQQPAAPASQSPTEVQSVPGTGEGQVQPAAPAPQVKPEPPTPSVLPGTPSAKPAPSTSLPGIGNPAHTEKPTVVPKPGSPSEYSPMKQPTANPIGPRTGPGREPEAPATGIVN
jgi:PsbP-like protein